jgi:hypothetical protein
MLIRNGSNISIKARLTGSYSGISFRDASLTGNPLPRLHAGGLSRHASTPVGHPSGTAYIPAQSSGGIASTNRTVALSTTSVSLLGSGFISASLTASASSTSDITGLKELAATFSGSCSISAPLVGRANISATLLIGASPSADDICFALLDTFEVRSGVTVRQALRRSMDGAENAFAVSA